jgi:hypothetical protein
MRMTGSWTQEFCQGLIFRRDAPRDADGASVVRVGHMQGPPSAPTRAEFQRIGRYAEFAGHLTSR